MIGMKRFPRRCVREKKGGTISAGQKKGFSQSRTAENPIDDWPGAEDLVEQSLACLEPVRRGVWI